MLKTNYQLVLRTNSKHVQKRLEDAGVRVCCCCNFYGVIWIECLLNPEHKGPINGVHGLGNSDENHMVYNEELDDYIDSRYNDDSRNNYLVSKNNCLESVCAPDRRYPVIDCGYNVDYFIKLIKEYEQQFK